jgi:flagellar basal body-associated protein FliL
MGEIGDIMDKQKMDAANAQLAQQPKKKSILFWVVIGIIIGVVVLIVGAFMLFFLFFAYERATYPYIPAPNHTLRSRSASELVSNAIWDMSEEAVKYSVYSRGRY